MDLIYIARRLATGISLAAATQGAASAASPGWHTYVADVSEDVDHGRYQSCSLNINLSFHDAACSFDSQSVAPQTSGLRVKISFTWSTHLAATVSVVGDSICHVKPEGLALRTWSLRSLNVDQKKSWIVESASPVANESVAALIQESEASGMVLQAVRADSSVLQFDVSPEEGRQESVALWRARKVSHAECINKLKPGEAP